MVCLRARDGARVHAPESFAREAATLSGWLESGCAAPPGGGEEEEVPVPNVDGGVLAQLVALHAQGASAAAARAWADLDLIPGAEAASYLGAERLLDALCLEIARRIRGARAGEIRRLLGIEADLDDAEEARLREAHSWAFGP